MKKKKKEIQNKKKLKFAKVFFEWFFIALIMFVVGYMAGRQSIYEKKVAKIQKEETTTNEEIIKKEKKLEEEKTKNRSVGIIDKETDLLERLGIKNKRATRFFQEAKIKKEQKIKAEKNAKEKKITAGYSIQLLATKKIIDAKKYVKKLKILNLDAYMISESNLYKVRVGFFKSRKKADKSLAMKILRDNHIIFFVTNTKKKVK